MVFATLLALTIVTVAVASLNLSESTTVLVAISIATVKASLVAMFFMHLKGEKPMVFWPLGLTAVLFAALFAFLLWTEGDHLFGTKFSDAFGTAKPTAPAATTHGEGGGGH
jgi:cytochrome c oxidase subunit 4